MTNEQKLTSLENILFQLQLSASRVTDEQHRKGVGNGLNKAIQDSKKMIAYYDSIQRMGFMEEESQSLSLHNMV